MELREYYIYIFNDASSCTRLKYLIYVRMAKPVNVFFFSPVFPCRLFIDTFFWVIENIVVLSIELFAVILSYQTCLMFTLLNIF